MGTNFLVPISSDGKQKNQIQNNSFFIQNCGQWDSSVLFFCKTPFGGATFKHSSVEYIFHNNDSFTVNFENTASNPTGFIKSPIQISYAYSKQTISSSTWKNVVYRNVLPGINISFHFSGTNLKYTISAQAHSSLKLLEFKVENASIKLVEKSMHFKTDKGNLLIDSNLIAWITKNTNQIPVNYRLIDTNRWILEIPVRFRHNNITIDPILNGFMVGGNNKETVNCINTDYYGNSWIGGGTLSPHIISQDKSNNTSNYDAFVMKIDTNGNPVKCIIFGGQGWDEVLGLDIAYNGDLVCCGGTDSIDFPITKSLSNNDRNHLNAFVVVVSNSKQSIYFSSILPGSLNDIALDIVAGLNNTIYITGYTSSVNFITTNKFTENNNLDNPCDIFITCLNIGSGNIEFSTIIGGSKWDAGFSICLDFLQNIYVTGYTLSTDFPVTSSALDSSLNGNEDVFVCRLSSAGDRLIFSTFIGGSSFEVGKSVSCDWEGNVYVAGFTDSKDFPTSKNAYQSYLNGRQDGFICKISKTGEAMMVSTYFGGSDWDEIVDLVTDFRGNIFITGVTLSSDFPITVTAENKNYSGKQDIFYAHVNSLMDTLIFSSYIGGEDWDSVGGIDIDINNNVYVAGSSLSSNIKNIKKLSDGGLEDIIFCISSTYPSAENCLTDYYLSVTDKMGALIVGNPYETSAFRTVPNSFSFQESVKTLGMPFMEGMQGPVCEYLQIVLNSNPLTSLHKNPNLAGCEGKETNYFGPYSKNALMKFQKMKNLQINGNITIETAIELDKLFFTLKRNPKKLVPSSWVLKPLYVENRVKIFTPDNIHWFIKVEDPTDHLQGWINISTVSFSPFAQEILESSIVHLDPKIEGGIGGCTEKIIADSVTSSYQNYLPESYPTELLLALIVHESYPSVHRFNNDLLTFDAGRGIQQITTNSYVGSGMGIALYTTTGKRYLPYWNCYEPGLSINYPSKHNANSEKFSGYYWVEAECQQNESFVYWGGIFRKDQCIGTSIYNCSLDNGGRVYSNTVLGIKANIYDGLTVLHDKLCATGNASGSYPKTFHSSYYDETIKLTEEDMQFISSIQRYHGYFSFPQDDPNSYLYAISLELERIGTSILKENNEYWFSSTHNKSDGKNYLVWAEKIRYVFNHNIIIL
ncbi:MAG: hypothetical protein KAH01_02740 [Caldisericia bacterium]|nr:hypothetical protein [Caldisericia bacterium]